MLVRRLKVAVGLSGDSELSEAIRVYGQVTLTKSSTAADVDSFLQEYMKARTEMIRQGLLSNTDPGHRVREREDFKRKIEGSELMRYLLELPEFPEVMDSLDETEARGRCSDGAASGSPLGGRRRRAAPEGSFSAARR